MKKTPIHLDRLARALADEGISLPRTRLLAVAASAFGFRNVHELSAADLAGSLDPMQPASLGVHHVTHVGEMQFLRDPSGYVYAIQVGALSQEGRSKGWHVAPLGGIACADPAPSTGRTAAVSPDAPSRSEPADPEIPYLLTDSDCAHVGGRERDYRALGYEFGSFENDFYPLDEKEQPYIADETVVSSSGSHEARIGYSAMFRGAKHLAPTVEFLYGEEVGGTLDEARQEARDFADAIRSRVHDIGGALHVDEDGSDAYGDPAVTIQVLVPIAYAMGIGSPAKWRKTLAALIDVPSVREHPDIRVEGDVFAVTLEYIGEGQDGDYDPLDPEDEPLYRFAVERLVDGKWEDVPDSCYCTQINADISPERARAAATYLLECIEQHGGPHLKRLCEQLSWVSIEKVEEHLA